jgi:hypothetical protein
MGQHLALMFGDANKPSQRFLAVQKLGSTSPATDQFPPSELQESRDIRFLSCRNSHGSFPLQALNCNV